MQLTRYGTERVQKEGGEARGRRRLGTGKEMTDRDCEEEREGDY